VCALGLVSHQAGKGDLAAALPFLDCLIPWLKAKGMEDAYCQARGLTSVAQKLAGDVEDKKTRGLGGQEHPLRWTGIHAG